MNKSIQTAIISLRKNTGRTILTVLGIVIGVAAVVIVLSAGQALKGFIMSEMESFGSNYIEIEVKTPQTSQTSTDNAISMVGGSVITTLTEDDAEAIARNANISKFYAGVMGQKIASFENEFKKTQLFGVNADFIDIDASEISSGRFFTEEENRALAKVAVLGYDFKQKLFGDSDAVGQYIKIGNDRFKVIGEMDKRGATFGFDMDNIIFLPLRTLQKRMLGIDYVSFIFAQTINRDLSARTADEIVDILRARHKIDEPNKDDFAVITQDQAMEMLGVVIYGIQALLIALGSISLIVGGVGIMNIMYVSVIERTYEIGLRKSVGAKYKDILWQFLSEAVIITIFGALLGVIFGICFSYLIAIVAQSFGFNWQFVISWTGIFLAVLMSTFVGLIFGLYPARQAAKKSPIEALRYE